MVDRAAAIDVSRGDEHLRDAPAATFVAACPDCGSTSTRMHSRYERTVADLGIGGRQTLLRYGCGGSSAMSRRTAVAPSLSRMRGDRRVAHPYLPQGRAGEDRPCSGWPARGTADQAVGGGGVPHPRRCRS
ncbi:transposase family protein [Dactylosporangium sp. NPDC005572]|uniref:transposase family protein n=1 Tax=Dactylosporangium sp. NPDC005572 TaxID=3156889 RepID=UPI0033B3F82E